MAEITLNHVDKRFGDLFAVRDLSLGIADGEFTVLLGPSGCGKTTTLRCIAGLESVDGGEVRIGGRLVNRVRPAERDIAFCFQHYALYPHLTAFNNIAFPLRTQKVAKDEVDRRVAEVAQLLHLDEYLDKRPAHLSSGEQQRVSLARAMVRRPRAYLMDEPLSTLDAKMREVTRVELRRMQTEMHATVVYVTHDQAEALAMADRIAVMHQGALQQVGTPDEIYGRPANLFVANFIGTPGMNFLKARVAGGGIEVRLDGRGFRLEVAPDCWPAIARGNLADLVVGVRPEDVRLRAAGEGVPAADIYVVEPLGSETIVDLRVGESVLKVRAEADFGGRPGETVGLEFDLERLHLFDPITGTAIR